jgi:PcrA/UvrD tudor domain
MASRRTGSTDWETFEVGDRVKHPKWGVGSILFKKGSGESAKAIVVFPERGQVNLMLKHAKLERIEEVVEPDEAEFDAEPSEEEAEEEEKEGEDDKDGKDDKDDKEWEGDEGGKVEILDDEEGKD